MMIINLGSCGVLFGIKCHKYWKHPQPANIVWAALHDVNWCHTSGVIT